MPFTTFKTQAGRGFRILTSTKIDVIHDLIVLYPSEGAINRTSMIIVEKPLEEFAKIMGYPKFNKHYMIPRALTLIADDETRKCFKLIRNMLEKQYYVEWTCYE